MGKYAVIVLAHFYFMNVYSDLLLKPLVEKINGVWYIEEWLPIKGYANLYHVSSFGRIKRLSKVLKCSGKRVPDKIIKIALCGKYLRFSLRKKGTKPKTVSIHRVVCTAFHDNPENKPQVNHLDTIKYNNFYLNLAWSTQSENIIHAQNAGIYPFAKPKTKMPPKKRGLPKGDIKLFKPIIDLNTGIFYTSKELCFILGKRNRTVGRILREERKPNTTQYRYC